jgi:ribosomal protein S18 acetylase RimI-like enzyme
VGSSNGQVSQLEHEPFTVIVRPARGDDLPAIADLTVLHSGGEHGQWLARLSEDLDRPGTCLLVAEDDGQVVGYGRVRRFDPDPQGPANLAPAGYYLLGLVVHPARRGQGIGEQLTRARMTWTAALAPEIWFFTNAANQASLRLHHRLGFREVTRDFTYPDVTFAGGTGVLCRARLSPDQT